MTTFGVLLLSGVGVAVVAFLVVVARGKRLRLAEEGPRQQQEAAMQTYMAARNMIADYGALMEKLPLGPTGIADISHLPHPKDDLIAAFRLVLLVTKEQPLHGQLQAGALLLAQYQPNVGPNVLSPLRLPDIDALQRMTADELATAVLEGSSDADKWEQFNVQVSRDIERISLAIGAKLPALSG